MQALHQGATRAAFPARRIHASNPHPSNHIAEIEFSRVVFHTSEPRKVLVE
jgi:hypothetical protein